MSPDKIQNPVSMFFTLKKAVEQIKPDILHTHCPRSMFLVPFLSSKYEKVETVHIYPGIQQKVLYGKWKGKIVIALSHFFTKKMDLPIACSESVAQSYWDEQHYKMRFIPNGSSCPVWQYDKMQKSRLKKELGLKEGVKYFIFIGRFSQEKNPDVVIQAFRALGRADIGLIMLGNGPLWNELKNQETENVRLPGFSNRVYEYIIAADYYISASDTEGLANTLLESMSAGLPMLLSDIPSHRSVMKMLSSDAGILYNRHHQSELLDGITNILKLDRIKAAENIQDVYAKEFTSEIMSKRYQEEYRNLLSK